MGKGWHWGTGARTVGAGWSTGARVAGVGRGIGAGAAEAGRPELGGATGQGRPELCGDWGGKGYQAALPLLAAVHAKATRVTISLTPPRCPSAARRWPRRPHRGTRTSDSGGGAREGRRAPWRTDGGHRHGSGGWQRRAFAGSVDGGCGPEAGARGRMQGGRRRRCWAPGQGRRCRAAAGGGGRG